LILTKLLNSVKQQIVEIVYQPLSFFTPPSLIKGRGTGG
jgi:hypothetical protein